MTSILSCDRHSNPPKLLVIDVSIVVSNVIV